MNRPSELSRVKLQVPAEMSCSSSDAPRVMLIAAPTLSAYSVISVHVGDGVLIVDPNAASTTARAIYATPRFTLTPCVRLSLTRTRCSSLPTATGSIAPCTSIWIWTTCPPTPLARAGLPNTG